MVGETWKSRYEPGALRGMEFILRSAWSWRTVTALYRFSPVLGSIPSNRTFCPERKKARTPWETFWITCAGAAGPWEKYLAPPKRPAPTAYPPAVRPRVPPVRLGRRVEAKGARLLSRPMLDAIREVACAVPSAPNVDLIAEVKAPAARVEKWRLRA